MKRDQLDEIRRALREIRKHPAGRRASDLERYADQVGRQLDNRGKEPTWVRKNDPSLSPPLSIPHHSKDMKLGTVRSIVDQLLDDLDSWEQYLLENEND